MHFQEPAPPLEPALACSACPGDLGIPQSRLPEPSKSALLLVTSKPPSFWQQECLP